VTVAPTAGHGAYLRLTVDGFDSQAVAAAAGRSLLFVDLGVHTLAHLNRVEDALTDIAPSLVHLDHLVFRWPSMAAPVDATAAVEAGRDVLEWLERLRERRLRLYSDIAVGAIRFQLGAPPQLLVSADNRRSDHADVLDRCREAELNALLSAGDAVWRPQNYHFRLPGGQHAATFVRLADAIRSPRDAFVLATWLAQHFEEHTGVLVDSPSVTPVITELGAMAAGRSWEAGPVVFLQDYPRTRVGVIEASRRAIGLSGKVLAILSVNSSGRVLDLLTESLDVVAPQRWSLDVLVDKRAHRGVLVGNSRMSSWVSLHDELAAPATPGSCPICRDHSRARVVFLDPRSFEPFLLPTPVLQHADESDAYRNRGLYKLAAETGSIGVECLPSAQGTPRGRRERMAVRFLHSSLFRVGNGIETLLPRQLRLLLDDQSDQTSGMLLQLESTDLVVVAREEFGDGDGPLSRALVTLITEALGISTSHVLPLSTRDNPTLPPSSEDIAALSTAKRPLLLALGSVTGWTLRQLRDAVRRMSPADATVSGLVVHSRPQSQREWDATREMFAGRCAAIWQTFLPWDSPLRREADLLNEFQQHVKDRDIPLPPPEAAFLRLRLDVVDPSDRAADWGERLERASSIQGSLAPDTVFWGPPGQPAPVRDRGPFGRSLNGISTYVAVGSAVQRARVREELREGPYWRAFSIRDAAHSRYDGVSLAALMRWLQPTETWWGDTDDDARETAGVMRNFMDQVPEERDWFVPEALLATAMGKVHPAAARFLTAWAGELSYDEPKLAPVLGLGLSLVEWARPMGT
jgi:hypothetical protein